ncbi:MAG: hypothetical protein JXA42_20385, partial [Anaerolineales bacterium]|nr:hypothetical protein [Anaerolineales bacterium]
MSDAKLGIFICDCGDRIASILDMETLERDIQGLPGVVTAKRLCHSCSPDGLAEIQTTIAEKGLDRVLVAGCTPKTLESYLRTACKKFGVNENLFELVDIREGCAWVHQNEPQAATKKAVDLIHVGTAKLLLRQEHQPITAKVQPEALVIGGGLAGIMASLTLANG